MLRSCETRGASVLDATMLHFEHDDYVNAGAVGVLGDNLNDIPRGMGWYLMVP